MKMKKIIIVSSLVIGLSLLSFNSMSEEIDTADSLKTKTLQACKAEAANLPEQDKLKALALCQCVADKTDYNLVIDSKAIGDKAAVDQHLDEVVSACKEEIGANQ